MAKQSKPWPTAVHKLLEIRLSDVHCVRCGAAHDGSIMRYDRRYTRVLNFLLSPELPRENGVLMLCHHCQRAAVTVGSFDKLLARDLRREVSREFIRRSYQGRQDNNEDGQKDSAHQGGQKDG